MFGSGERTKQRPSPGPETNTLWLFGFEPTLTLDTCVGVSPRTQIIDSDGIPRGHAPFTRISICHRPSCLLVVFTNCSEARFRRNRALRH